VAAGLDDHQRVPVVGGGNVNGVDVRAGQQVAEVVVGLAVLVAVVLIHPVLGVVTGALTHVADSDVLDVLAAEESPQVAASLVADADAPHDDPFAGRRAFAGARGGRPGKRSGGGSPDHKLRRHDGAGHKEALRDTLVTVLLSPPHFCYCMDVPEQGTAARPLSDYAQASRPGGVSDIGQHVAHPRGLWYLCKQGGPRMRQAGGDEHARI
jgi:hypothetical protein